MNDVYLHIPTFLAHQWSFCFSVGSQNLQPKCSQGTGTCVFVVAPLGHSFGGISAWPPVERAIGPGITDNVLWVTQTLKRLDSEPSEVRVIGRSCSCRLISRCIWDLSYIQLKSEPSPLQCVCLSWHLCFVKSHFWSTRGQSGVETQGFLSF